ncbi:threonine synthase [Paenibacillus sedimenti]|uniref:Threonine synthase n=1 Tax=Paenibacillus sedimenti TaxID=2770274 RepID=A0A926KR92_9BACL|nr:threonine synthase [Paenibacillus sedimenti]MBD0380759.1 threonine synthase [Paenibacillus sedimenti]
MNFVCIDCGTQLPIGKFAYQCACGGLLEVIHDFRGVDAERLKRLFTERLSERMSPYASGVWRYKELIAPEQPEEMICTKYEGNTGLYPASWSLNRFAGVRGLWFKAQSENPSGSFKDNGMTVAVSHGRSLGYKQFTCTSTGNTSSSLAMYAAFGGESSCVFVPNKDISINKVLQTLAYGATVISFDGTYDDGILFLEKHADELGLYVCNSVNPLRIEGQKSIVYEIAQSLNWQLPDWIVLPGGALSNATALGKGLRDLKELGFIERLPRVAVVQAEGASPFHQMMAEAMEELAPQREPYTRASALNIGNPPSWRKARRVLEETGGVTTSVSDAEILDAKAVIDRSGIGCEPASAAALAGLRKLVRAGIADKDETAVCILTGHLLKDTDALKEYHLDAKWPSAAHRNALVASSLIREDVSKHLRAAEAARS